MLAINMISAREFANLLASTFTDANNELRREKELQISNFLSAQPEDFTSITVQILSDSSFDDGARKYALITFQSAFKFRKHEMPSPVWRQLNPRTRLALKDAAFALLMTPDGSLRQMVSNTLALIYMLDLTHQLNQIGDILDAMCSNVMNDNVEFSGIAITTLGHIADLMTLTFFQYLHPDKQQIFLGAICNALKSSNENAPVIIAAVSRAMPLMTKNYNDEKFLSFILEHLLKYLKFGIDSNNPALIHDTVNCLGQAVKYGYHLMQKYMPVVIGEVLQLNDSRELTVRKAACEFLMKILKNEKMYRKGFFDQGWETLANSTLNGLFKTVKEDRGSPEDMLEALDNYSRVLNALNELYADKTFAMLGGLVVENIDTNDPMRLIIAVVLVDSMTGIKGRNRQDEFQPIFDKIYHLIGSNFAQTPVLQITASSCIQNMLDQCVKLAFHQNNLQQLANILLEVVSQPEDGNEMTIQRKMVAFHCLDSLATKTKDVRDCRIALSNLTETIFGVLQKICVESSDPTILDSLFATMFAFLECVIEPEYLGQFFQPMVNLVNYFLGRPANENTPLFVESIVINLNLILTRIGQAGIKAFSDHPNRESFMREMLIWVSNISEHPGFEIAYNEAMVLMTTIISNNGDIFKGAVVEFYERYLQKVLTGWHDPLAVAAVIMAFMSLVKAFPVEMTRQTEDFLAFVLQAFKANVPDDLKVPIYNFISDIMINQPHMAKKFAEPAMAMNIHALEAVVHVQENMVDVEEYKNFWVPLRDAVLENMLCFVHGLLPLNDQTITRTFEEGIVQAQEFLYVQLASKNEPSQEFIRLFLDLMIDSMTRIRRAGPIKFQYIREAEKLLDMSLPESHELKRRIEEVQAMVRL